MLGLTLATVVGVLFASGTFLILRRAPIRLILGLGLLSHGVNLLIFSTSVQKRGLPPIIPDKANFDGVITPYVDPLPQALILTAIVISFGITAFMIVLISRRAAIMAGAHAKAGEVGDPFGTTEHYLSGLDEIPDDYVWLEYSLADEYRHRQNQEGSSDDGEPSLED